MDDDITIDTNVWAHAQNPAENRFENSLSLIKSMLETETLLCVDEGFNLDESKNRSAICCEYIKHISYGSVGFSLLVRLASSGRIKQLEKRSSQATSRKINQIISNKVDRIFLNVAFNSDKQYLVSHDFKDFQKTKRTEIKKKLSISILEAEDAILLLQES